MTRSLLLLLTVGALQSVQARAVLEQTTDHGTPAALQTVPVPAVDPASVDLSRPIRTFMQDAEPVTDADISPVQGPSPAPASPPEASLIPFMGSDVFLPQDLPPVAKPRLLPDRMSFMERGLWGEDGVFRSWGITGQLTPETRKHELEVRRTMLSAHQIGGFATLASMIATVYFGQKFLDNGDRKALDMHETFIPITVGLYTATGMLSILSPPPLIRRDEVSTTSIHKLLAWVHVAGMIITPILGAAISRRSASFEEKARVHQVAGYITTGVFAASMIVITF